MTRLELAIGLVLRAGVTASSLCLGVGLLMSFAGVGAAATSQLLLQVGILVLLGTPAARVVVSVVEYVLERDWTFAALTLVVLGELAASAIAALVFNKRI